MATDRRFDLRRWLPTSVKEIELLGWDHIDVIIFSGDAYVDHPSFGASVMPVGRCYGFDGQPLYRSPTATQ